MTNNRVIKFRAWNRAFNRMEESVTPAADGSGRVWISNGISFEHDEGARDSFVIMQFTGLHDKNGKEIFGDDVLKVLCEDDGSGFWNSRIGEFQKKHDLSHFLIHIYAHEIRMEFLFKILAIKKDGSFFTFNELEGTEEAMKLKPDPWFNTEVGLVFIDYLSGKKAVEVLGNIHQHPHLLVTP